MARKTYQMEKEIFLFTIQNSQRCEDSTPAKPKGTNAWPPWLSWGKAFPQSASYALSKSENNRIFSKTR